MTADPGRYAIYFAPEPASALARFGAAWIGYDAATGETLAQPERLRTITAEPRHYGFHATLKPPFALAEGADGGSLDAAVARLADSINSFVAPSLRLACLSGFWALMLSEPCAPMVCLAAACVSDIDCFRAPPSAAELARRRRSGLSPSQDALLERWGYPYVMEEFRFHMTLTARLDGEESAAVGRELAALVEPACEAGLAIDAISLFRQESREAPFRLLRRHSLAPAR